MTNLTGEQFRMKSSEACHLASTPLVCVNRDRELKQILEASFCDWFWFQ